MTVERISLPPEMRTLLFIQWILHLASVEHGITGYSGPARVDTGESQRETWTLQGGDGKTFTVTLLPGAPWRVLDVVEASIRMQFTGYWRPHSRQHMTMTSDLMFVIQQVSPPKSLPLPRS
jgi:hypothetical protein